MLVFLETQASARKLKLFALSCCRRIWCLLPNKESRVAIEIAERAADASASPVDVAKARADLSQACRYYFKRIGLGIGYHAPRESAMYSVAEAALTDPMAPQKVSAKTLEIAAREEEPSAQCNILREIHGNPFRRLPPRPEAIAPLAERIYAGEWELMPILGEWLQEHGYWSEGEHCLDPNIHHVKGCWVVDWVTGRE
jgi:hypothetical protein